MISFTGVAGIDVVICTILKWLVIYLIIASVIAWFGIILVCKLFRKRGFLYYGRKHKH